MRLLLDSHGFLSFIDDSPRLSETAKRLIEDTANDIYVSIASLWEVAIKSSLGKLNLRQPYEILIPGQLIANDFAVLEISMSHLARAASLPFHHRDRFDRMLIAQSQVEQMPIVSADPALDAYGIMRLW